MNGAALENLKSAVQDTSDVPRSLEALEQSVAVCRDLARNAVDAFLKADDDGYLIAERLVRFGSLIGEFLSEGFPSISDERKKTLAALLLYLIKHEESEDVLLERLRTETPSGYLGLLASRIREDTMPKALPVLVQRAKPLFADEALGGSFESNPNKDALVALLDVLRLHDVSLVDEFAEEIRHVERYPAEIRNILQ